MNIQDLPSTPSTSSTLSTGGTDEQLLSEAFTALSHGMTLQEFESIEHNEIKAVIHAAATTITISPFTSSLKEQFSQELVRLQELADELTRTIVTTDHQNAAIRQRINNLVALNGVKINAEHYQSFEQSITTYLQLLANIREEIEREMTAYQRYLTLTEPLAFLVPREYAASTSDIFIQHKIRWLRHHAKAIRKDLAISFSRYSFGFEKQLHQIEGFEAHFKTAPTP